MGKGFGVARALDYLDDLLHIVRSCRSPLPRPQALHGPDTQDPTLANSDRNVRQLLLYPRHSHGLRVDVEELSIIEE